MNRIQLSGKVNRVHIDEFQGKVVGAEFILEQEAQDFGRNIAIIPQKQWYKCVAIHQHAILLSNSWIEGHQVVIEGVIFSKNSKHDKPPKIYEFEIHVNDMLVLPKK